MGSRYYYLTQKEGEHLGWLGGNPPLWFDKHKHLIEETDIEYGFYCTFAIDSLRSISIFIPEKYSELLDKNIYPNCSIKTVLHPTTEESCHSSLCLMPEKPEFGKRLSGRQRKFDYMRPLFEKMYLTSVPEDENEPCPFITIGSDIFYIQDKNYYREQLEQEGYHIWGYINEEGYYPLARRLDFIHGNYPLGYGAIYLYAKNERIIAGYWQYS